MKILKLELENIYNDFINSEYLNEFINIKQELMNLVLSNVVYSFRDNEEISINLNEINDDYSKLYDNFFTKILDIEYTNDEDSQLMSIEDSYLLWLEEKLHLKLNIEY